MSGLPIESSYYYFSHYSIFNLLVDLQPILFPVSNSNMFRHGGKDKNTAAPKMPRSGDSITRSARSQDSLTRSTRSCESFTTEDYESSDLPDFHSSFVSTITMDDALGVSDRFAGSERYQYRLDPRMTSLAEQKRNSSGLDSEEIQQTMLDASIPPTNFNRFSTTAGASDTLTAPLRRLSLSHRSSYTAELEAIRNMSLGSSSHHRSSSADSLDYRGSGHRKVSSRSKSAFTDSGHLRLSSHHKSFTSSDDSSDFEYRTEDFADNSFFLDEDNLGHVEEASDESNSSHDPLHGDLSYVEHEEGLNDEQDELENHHHTSSAPRRNYHQKTVSPSMPCHRSGLSNQSLDLLDIFGDITSQ